MSDLGTEIKDSNNSLFMDSMDQPNHPYRRLFKSSPGSRCYNSPQASTIKWDDNPTRPTSKRQTLNITSPYVPLLYRNINLFPFRPVGITTGLRID